MEKKKFNTIEIFNSKEILHLSVIMISLNQTCDYSQKKILLLKNN